MDRLLNEQEIDCCIENNFYDRDGELSIPKLLKSQLAKTDKEWMAWLLENLFRETDYGLEWQTTPRVALKRLAERKLEIGI